MITKKQYEDAKALIATYREECIAKNPIKNGGIYKYRDELLRVSVEFDDKSEKTFYRITSPQKFEIVDNKLKFYEGTTDSNVILIESKQVEQIEGKELERLKELNNLAFQDWNDIDSKKETEKLKAERKELLRKCCHDWKKTWKEKEMKRRLLSSDKIYICKVCDLKILTN